MYVCICIYIYIYTFSYIYIYIYTYIFIHIYMCIHTYSNGLWSQSAGPMKFVSLGFPSGIIR